MLVLLWIFVSCRPLQNNAYTVKLSSVLSWRASFSTLNLSGTLNSTRQKNAYAPLVLIIKVKRFTNLSESCSWGCCVGGRQSWLPDLWDPRGDAVDLLTAAKQHMLERKTCSLRTCLSGRQRTRSGCDLTDGIEGIRVCVWGRFERIPFCVHHSFLNNAIIEVLVTTTDFPFYSFNWKQACYDVPIISQQSF